MRKPSDPVPAPVRGEELDGQLLRRVEDRQLGDYRSAQRQGAVVVADDRQAVR